uniref:Uncharacterized protein n=1 Tax=Haptolina brevifila TaxID=156173 RepID=A0A7S2CA61_9EUKA|mmetsp:Transcript_22355/g.44946  ORF Transcript_22355/g.44946 Transcript_22355/m.44946 type:complete len:128 (+) Transcript_22355:54-437(+)
MGHLTGNQSISQLMNLLLEEGTWVNCRYLNGHSIIDEVELTVPSNHRAFYSPVTTLRSPLGMDPCMLSPYGLCTCMACCWAATLSLLVSTPFLPPAPCMASPPSSLHTCGCAPLPWAAPVCNDWLAG